MATVGQGEVGSACATAAGGPADLGGTPEPAREVTNASHLHPGNTPGGLVGVSGALAMVGRATA